MKRLCLTLLAAVLALECGYAQQPPKPGPPGPTPQPSPVPSAPAPQRDKTRVIGRVLPAYGSARLPDLMTVAMTSLTGGFYKIVMVHGSSFEFVDVPRGSYKLKLESIGYEPMEKEFDVESLGAGHTQFVTVHLGPQVKEKDEIDPGEGPTTISAEALAIPPKALREMQKAQEASAKDKPQKAVDHLLKAVKIHPDYYEAYNNLAVQYVKLGRTDDARRSFEKSIEIKPTARAFLNLGIIHYQQRRHSEAIKCLIRSQELEPENETAIRALAEVYYQIGQYVLALQRYQELATLSDDPTVSLAMGYCYVKLRFYDDARKHFQHFLTAQPEGSKADQVRNLLARMDRIG